MPVRLPGLTSRMEIVPYLWSSRYDHGGNAQRAILAALGPPSGAGLSDSLGCRLHVYLRGLADSLGLHDR
eukprot:1398625-Pyramimonas_sp.AAC.1